MLQIKILGATPKGGKGICATCKHAKKIIGQNCEEIIFCHTVFDNTRYGGVVPFRIAECTQYHPSNMPWLHEMEQMAWTVEAKRRGPVGFGDGATEMEYVITAPNGDDQPWPK